MTVKYINGRLYNTSTHEVRGDFTKYAKHKIPQNKLVMYMKPEHSLKSGLNNGVIGSGIGWKDAIKQRSAKNFIKSSTKKADWEKAVRARSAKNIQKSEKGAGLSASIFNKKQMSSLRKASNPKK